MLGYSIWALPNEPSNRRLGLLACATCRRVWAALDDERGQEAVLAAEQFADDLVPADHLEEAAEVIGKALGEFASNYARLFGGAKHRAGDAAMQAAAITTYDSLSRSDLEDVLRHAAEGAQRPNEPAAQADLIRELFGNPFQPTPFSAGWRTDAAMALARQMYEVGDFSALPVLADALQDAGCDNADILEHCRGPGPHVRGCWVVDLVLAKE